MTKRNWSAEQKAAIRVDWVGDVHIRDMMVRHNCSNGALRGLIDRENWPSRDYVRVASPNAAPAPGDSRRHKIQHSTANEPAIDLAAQRAHDARMARPVITARPVANPFAVPVRLTPKLECTSYKPRGGDRDERVSVGSIPLHYPEIPSNTREQVATPAEPLPATPSFRAPAPKIEAPVKYGRVIECCWPIGQPGTAGFRFCEVASLPATPYCQDHANRAYARSAPKQVDAALPG